MRCYTYMWRLIREVLCICTVDIDEDCNMPLVLAVQVWRSHAIIPLILISQLTSWNKSVDERGQSGLRQTLNFYPGADWGLACRSMMAAPPVHVLMSVLVNVYVYVPVPEPVLPSVTLPMLRPPTIRLRLL
jgi:hypothetical protein